jgi:hypothetical protein
MRYKYKNGGKPKGDTTKTKQYDPYGFPINDTTGTSSYEKMAKYLLSTRGGSRERMEDLMYDIASVESSETEDMPEWLSNYIDESNGVYDFSKLTTPQQKALFLADYSQAGHIKFGDYMKGNRSTEDMWADFHKVSGADRPHFREMKEVGDRKKDARALTSEKFREIVTGKSFMP